VAALQSETVRTGLVVEGGIDRESLERILSRQTLAELRNRFIAVADPDRVADLGETGILEGGSVDLF
jgi:hypothetical protein